MISRESRKEQALIEDVIAQNHILVDSLTFGEGTLAKSVLQTISETTERAGPFAQLLGMTFEEMAGGRCTASLQVKQHLLNPHGIAHGGVTFSLADSVCGGAALSAIGGPRILTQDMQIRYHGPARPGTITASAEVIHHGQRTITVQGKVKQNTILIASVTATFAILTSAEMIGVERGGDE
jgi:acyl-CoA thioesterase